MFVKLSFQWRNIEFLAVPQNYFAFQTEVEVFFSRKWTVVFWFKVKVREGQGQKRRSNDHIHHIKAVRLKRSFFQILDVRLLVSFKAVQQKVCWDETELLGAASLSCRVKPSASCSFSAMWTSWKEPYELFYALFTLDICVCVNVNVTIKV